MAAPEERGDEQTRNEETGEMVGAEAPERTFLEIAFICNTLQV